MRQIYKDLVIGFILASFVFAPGAFAKPRAPKVSSKSPASRMLKTVRAHKKKKLKLSKLVTSAKPMLHKTIYRSMKKSALPYWDKKFDTAEIGDDYFKLSLKGKTVFGKYINNRNVAFIINNKAIYWKDVKTYGAAKSRIMEILGVRQKRKSKVSLIEMMLSEMWPEAYAETKPSDCTSLGGDGAKYDKQNKTCICNNNYAEYSRDKGCVIDHDAQCEETEPGTVYNDDKDACVCPDGSEWGGQKIRCNGAPHTPLPPEAKEEEERNPWLLPLIIGAGVLLAFFLFKGDDDDDKPSAPPVVNRPKGWTPEGTTPTEGARDPNANGGIVVF